MKRLIPLIAATMILGLAMVTATEASTSYTASLGAHGGTRWTLSQSVYVNLKAMTPGIWKQQLWSGTCAQPTLRTAPSRLRLSVSSNSSARGSSRSTRLMALASARTWPEAKRPARSLTVSASSS